MTIFPKGMVLCNCFDFINYCSSAVGWEYLKISIKLYSLFQNSNREFINSVAMLMMMYYIYKYPHGVFPLRHGSRISISIYINYCSKQAPYCLAAVLHTSMLYPVSIYTVLLLAYSLQLVPVAACLLKISPSPLLFSIALTKLAPF